MKPTSRIRVLTALPVVMTLTAAMVTSASARIKCSNGFQSVGGTSVATPYCQDELVAIVARQYGVKTTPAAIRANPIHKRHVCQLVGRDIRLQHACINTNGIGRRGF